MDFFFQLHGEYLPLVDLTVLIIKQTDYPPCELLYVHMYYMHDDM